MTAFIYECAGRLRVLKVVKIRGSWDSPEVLPPLRPPVFKAASRFKAVESLELRNICFWSYENLARLVWAFSPVEELKMDNLSWQRGETAHGLANEPFSKPLCPKSIAVRD
ncbi:hypothetical protein OBBRIDRAFT_799136 [Obba rivulosa]|uniref:Uncharacterized protein n=1 Tax=Obba rivulosa TaxID=1052685 RepID=A0A8E2ALX3_9APHY|nr:hypothetical protein OBBRIDRAFT_799136 [Obba rivulosa]